ncbi:hypothetical protein OK016_22675 [Vibrio chagasii]|nr:hypothetical protein [Vibrio chagasii]
MLPSSLSLGANKLKPSPPVYVFLPVASSGNSNKLNARFRSMSVSLPPTNFL